MAEVFSIAVLLSDAVMIWAFFWAIVAKSAASEAGVASTEGKMIQGNRSTGNRKPRIAVSVRGKDECIA